MGMYTELHYNAELRADVPSDVVDILKLMLGEAAEGPETPDHPLFGETRWRFMLQCDSYYFDADTHSTLRKDRQGGLYLCVRCNLKNYDDEIEKFCDWIRPYINKQEGGFLGFSRDKGSQTPTLIFA